MQTLLLLPLWSLKRPEQSVPSSPETSWPSYEPISYALTAGNACGGAETKRAIHIVGSMNPLPQYSFTALLPTDYPLRRDPSPARLRAKEALPIYLLDLQSIWNTT